MKFSYRWLNRYFENKLPPAQKVVEVLTLHSFETNLLTKGKNPVFDIDLLTNRVADASGHWGISRELSALLGLKLNLPAIRIKASKQKINDFLEVIVKDKKDAPRYTARMIKNIKVKDSPLWLKEELRACGLKPINNIVDATNFVMLETGQPLHAFDYDLLAPGSKNKKRILVRRAQKGEKIITLDGEEKILDNEILVIADSQKPIALAGIKGGKETGIHSQTKNIIIEAANFNPTVIRRGSQKLNIKTDASWRFEHSLSPALIDKALDRVCDLICQLAGGEVLAGKIDITDFKNKPIQIILNLAKLRKFLGFEISAALVEKSLKAFGFQLKLVKPNLYLVSVPLERNDIFEFEDLAGEIMRYLGYENLESVPPQEILKLPAENELWQLTLNIRHWIKALDLEEVYNYAFISLAEKSLFDKNWQAKLIEVSNPLSNEFRYLKPTLIGGLLKNARDNFRFYPSFSLFEIARVFYQNQKRFFEEPVFSGIIARKERAPYQEVYNQAKSLITSLLSKLGFDADDYSFRPTFERQYDEILDKNYSVSLYLNNKFIGLIGRPKKEFLNFYKLTNNQLVVWEIYLLPLISEWRGELEYEPLPQYPAVIYDLSLLAPKNLLVDEILKIIFEAAPQYLEDIDLFDLYEDERLGADKKSLSFHLIFRDKNKTLKSEIVAKEMEKIYQALKKAHIEIR